MNPVALFAALYTVNISGNNFVDKSIICEIHGHSSDPNWKSAIASNFEFKPSADLQEVLNEPISDEDDLYLTLSIVNKE